MIERGDRSSPFEAVVIQELVRVRDKTELPSIIERALERYEASV